MANRRPQMGGNGGRRMDFQRNDQRKNYGRVSPWQGGGPGGAGLPNLMPMAGNGGPTEATLALASNILNLLQPRQAPVPSLLDMPIRRDFVPNMGRFDHNFPPQRMGNQGNFRRTGNYNRAGERINSNRKQFKPNDGQRQQNKSSPKKEADSKAKPVMESLNSEPEDKSEAQEPENKTQDTKKELPKTRYDEVHNSLLKCHICNKSMWDGRSFENHLSGRAHGIMMLKTAESYALTADTMRQEFKIREMKRTRKAGPGPQAQRDFYCAMCDMYAADGGVHRTTVGHRKLKKYLHPTCTSCHKEMPTRIELDEHRLSAEHLRNMQHKQEDITKPKPEVMVISTITMEQTFLREDRQRKRHDHKEKQAAVAAAAGAVSGSEENADASTTDIVVKKEPGMEGAEGEGEKAPRKCWDTDKTIIDHPEGELGDITPDMFPSYSTDRGVGASFLAEFKCLQCRLCNKLLDTQETAEVHLRTWKHHQLFVKSLRPNPIPAPKEVVQKEQEPEAGSKRSHDSSDDGNWKRRRADTDADAQDDNDNERGHGYVKTDCTNRIGIANILSVDGVLEEPDAAELSEADVAMPNQDELEDWEQSVDEILEDEKVNLVQGDQGEGAKPPPQATDTLAPPPLPPPPRTKARRGRGRN